MYVAMHNKLLASQRLQKPELFSSTHSLSDFNEAYPMWWEWTLAT